MGAWKKATLLAGLMMISGLAGCFGNDDDDSKGEMVAVFTYSPATNIRAGQTIDFDAGEVGDAADGVFIDGHAGSDLL